MNSDKFKFGQDPVESAGIKVTQSGVRTARKYLWLIENFPDPTNISEVRSIFRMPLP